MTTLLRAGAYAVPFLPLYVSTSLLYPFVTGRNFAFRIITELLLVPLAALWTVSRRHRPQLTPVAVALLAFVAIVAIVDALGVHPMRSFWSTFQRMDGLLRLVHVALFFLILRSAFETREQWQRYFMLSVAVSVLVASMGLLEYAVKSASGQVRPSIAGTIGNGGIFGAYLMLHVFVALALFIHASARTKYLLIGAIVLNFVAAYLSGNRSSMLALAVVGPVTALALYRSRRIVIAAGVAAVAGAVLLTMFGIPLAERFRREAAGTGDSPRSVAWTAAMNTIRERPLLGWGQENFYVGWDKYYAAAGEAGFDRAHSTPLEWLIAGGVLAFAAYAAVMAAFAWTIWRLGRSDRRTAIALGAFLAAHTIFSLFWFDTLETQLVVVSVLAFADWSLHGPRAVARPVAPLTAWRTKPVVAGTAAAVVFVVAVYALNVRPALAARAANDGLIAWRTTGRLADSLASFQAAFDYQGIYKQDVIEAMASMAPPAVAVRAGSQPGEAKAFADTAIRELQALIASGPAEARHLIMLGNVAGSASTVDAGYRALAIASFERARAISPNNEQTYQAMARFYAASGEYETAFTMQRRAIALAPKSPGLELELVRLKVMSGLSTPADYAAARAYFRTQPDLRGTVMSYVQAGEFEIARLVVEEMLRRDPDNAELRQQHEAIRRRVDAGRR